MNFHLRRTYVKNDSKCTYTSPDYHSIFIGRWDWVVLDCSEPVQINQERKSSGFFTPTVLSSHCVALIASSWGNRLAGAVHLAGSQTNLRKLCNVDIIKRNMNMFNCERLLNNDGLLMIRLYGRRRSACHRNLAAKMASDQSHTV